MRENTFDFSPEEKKKMQEEIIYFFQEEREEHLGIIGAETIHLM